MATLARLACLGLLLAACGARADEPAGLALTVHPSGTEETLDERLARRDGSFRFICLGCGRAPGQVDPRPFEPIRTLNAPMLTEALGPGRPEIAR